MRLYKLKLAVGAALVIFTLFVGIVLAVGLTKNQGTTHNINENMMLPAADKNNIVPETNQNMTASTINSATNNNEATEQNTINAVTSSKNNTASQPQTAQPTTPVVIHNTRTRAS
jgi:hypothetical protein